MHILVSNDDGVLAPGLKILVDALKTIATVDVVVPDRNRSGASNSLTLQAPLRIQTLDNGYVSVEGTPTDCVHLAITGLVKKEPDLVVSGINYGANLGDDIFYSGTVAAATEGRRLGIPALSISLVGRDANHYDTAAAITLQVINQLTDFPMHESTILNINVPDCPLDKLSGVAVTRLGSRHRGEPTIPGTDPRGHKIYWVGPPGAEQDAGEGTDFYAINSGCVSLTPICLDLTHTDSLALLGEMVDKIN